MQSTQRNYADADHLLNHPANDENSLTQESIMQIIKPLSRQQNAVYRSKVLTRKRKRSKHPLRELRIRAGFTLEELADLTQMSPSYLSRLESGTRRLNADILQRLSFALACNPGDLLPYQNNTYGINKAVESEANTAGAPTQKDLPVYRLAGTMKDHGQIYADVAENWISRPAELTGVMGAFACVIKDANFGPRYNDGDKILLHPTAPLSSQCSVLAVTNDNQAYIGRFVSWDKDSAATNPSTLTLDVIMGKTSEAPRTERVTFDRSKLKGTYRIIGTFEAA